MIEGEEKRTGGAGGSSFFSRAGTTSGCHELLTSTAVTGAGAIAFITFNLGGNGGASDSFTSSGSEATTGTFSLCKNDVTSSMEANFWTILDKF